MEKWIVPVLEELEISMTKNGSAPATYESDYAGKIMLNNQSWCVVSGFLWESGMDMKGYTTLERPYVFSGGNTIFYN